MFSLISFEINYMPVAGAPRLLSASDSGQNWLDTGQNSAAHRITLDKKKLKSGKP